MDKLHQKYGPIISLSLIGRGKWDVWFQGYDLLKEVMNDPRFTARSSISLFEQLGMHKGIGFASGEEAKVKRRMTIQVLKALGVGKSVFSVGIEEEVERLLKYVEDLGDQDIYIQVWCLYADLSHYRPPPLLCPHSLLAILRKRKSNKRNSGSILFRPNPQPPPPPPQLSQHKFFMTPRRTCFFPT